MINEPAAKQPQSNHGFTIKPEIHESLPTLQEAVGYWLAADVEYEVEQSRDDLKRGHWEYAGEVTTTNGWMRIGDDGYSIRIYGPSGARRVFAVFHGEKMNYLVVGLRPFADTDPG